MTRILILVLSVSLIWSCKTPKRALASEVPVNATIDLTSFENDLVKVTIDPGQFAGEKVIFRLPKIVQGTYSDSSFGQFIEELQAFDYNGNPMSIDVLDKNSWSIGNATQLDRIVYKVADTYDDKSEATKKSYLMSGTANEDGFFMLNLHGYVGYFEEIKNSAYDLAIVSPKAFKAASPLPIVKTEAAADTRTDYYYASRYFQVTDNPMFYGDITIESFKVGDMDIELSVFSPNKIYKASDFLNIAKKTMEAQKRFLGELNNTKSYDIMLFLYTIPSSQGGALEHHTSTVVCLPENMPKVALEEQMKHIVSHEFFHILTPLAVHSEDVHDFDYHSPTFSKHLWMYEGVTEYFSNLFQVNQDLITEDAFYGLLQEKITQSAGFDDRMSFTKMSENILEEKYQNNYINVYMKGALIGMCIDIILRENTNGQKGILNLMKRLSAKYGVDKPFNDDAFIQELKTMTNPAIANFLDTHVVGETPIDYTKIFDKVGLEFGNGEIPSVIIMKNQQPVVSPDMSLMKLKFNGLVNDMDYWNTIDIKEGDILAKIDGKPLTFQNANELITQWMSKAEGSTYQLTIERDGVEKTIDAVYELTKEKVDKVLQPKENATEAQLALRLAWLKK